MLLSGALPAAASELAWPMHQLMTSGGASTAPAAAPTGGTTPAQMRHFYGVDLTNFAGTPADGRGQTIAVVDAYDDPTAMSDLHNFDLAYQLPDPPSFRQFNESGQLLTESGGNATPPPTTPAGMSSWEVEESLDVQWAHVMAPAASLVLVEADTYSLSDLMIAASAASQISGVVCVSMSFGGLENRGEHINWDGIFTAAGITFVAAVGDNPATGLYPAFSPNVVAVGGTTIFPTPDGSYFSEALWANSGNGASQYEPEPAFQQSVQTSTAREIPDVVMAANPLVPFYDSFDFGAATPWSSAGGTSLSTALFAGIVAIADQGRVQAGQGTLTGSSQTLPDLYAFPTSDFHAIPTGSAGGWTATAGLGSPTANRLVNGLAGVAAAPVSTVLGRYIFYNNSVFDGNNPAANSADDQAIDPTKHALLPGQGPATFANYTNYSRGINGIMIDLSNPLATLTVSDFAFAAGNSADPTQWAAVAAPTILVRPGSGMSGSTRIELVWPDGVVRNEWLQVTVKVTFDTNLSVADVFYFGNLVAETGKPPVNKQFVVTSADLTAARNDPHGFLSPAPMTDTNDFNRDGRVDATDQLLAREYVGQALFDLMAPSTTAIIAQAASQADAAVTLGAPLLPVVPTFAPLDQKIWRSNHIHRTPAR